MKPIFSNDHLTITNKYNLPTHYYEPILADYVDENGSTDTVVDVTAIYCQHVKLPPAEAFKGEEPRAFMELCGFTVSGESDRIEVDPVTGKKTLRDIKSTSSFMLKKLMADMEVHVPGRSLADMKVHTPVLFKYAIQQSIYNVLYKLGLTTATLDFIIINHSPLDRSTIGEALQGYVIPIATEEDTVAFMIDILTKVKQYRASGYLPNCTETETSGKPQPLFKLVKNPSKPRKVNGSGDYRSRAEAAQAMAQYPGTVVFDATQFAKPDLCTKYCQFCNVTNHLGETVCTQGTDLYNREN